MSKTILIVDDSSSVRSELKTALIEAGYIVIEGCDGKDALQQLQGKKIDLIASDVNMPVMDGITFITEAKKLTNCKFTPVILFITETEKEKIQQGREAGANAWLVKPIKPAQVLETVSRLLM